MEPKLPTPNFQPEQSPVVNGQNAERTVPAPAEVGLGGRIEKTGESYNEVQEQAPAAPVLPPPVLVVPGSQPTQTTAEPSAPVSDMPLVAGDEDLIEKEWVDKAKKIVEETKDDPYRREQEVGKLQADYLRKRYGKELHTS